MSKRIRPENRGIRPDWFSLNERLQVPCVSCRVPRMIYQDTPADEKEQCLACRLDERLVLPKMVVLPAYALASHDAKEHHFSSPSHSTPSYSTIYESLEDANAAATNSTADSKKSHDDKWSPSKYGPWEYSVVRVNVLVVGDTMFPLTPAQDGIIELVPTKDTKKNTPKPKSSAPVAAKKKKHANENDE